MVTKYLIVTENGREHTIEADDLDNAEKIANKKYPKWVDIKIKNYKAVKDS